MNRPPLHPFDADLRRIEPCEPRLALSASLAGGLLLEALGVTPPISMETSSMETSSDQIDSVASNSADAGGSSDPFESPDLFEQAFRIREGSEIDGRGQTVAVIDSGVAWDHVALGGGFGPGYRVVGGWDFAEDDADPYDDGPAGYHGTHVSALLAGRMEGHEGIAPGADLVALRVFDDDGVGQLQWIESALDWVHENRDAFASPITTVNLSIGAALDEANRAEAVGMLEDELAVLREDGILVFAASGNLFDEETPGTDAMLYPASSPSVVGVASLDAAGSLSAFSQRDTGVLAAGGEAITGAVPDHVFGWDGHVDDVAALDGTSMATPQIAAASMLVRQALLEQGLDPTPEDVLAQLAESARDRIDPVTGASYHMIDLEAAIIEPPSADPPIAIARFDGDHESQDVELDLRDGILLRVDGLAYVLDPEDAETPLVIDVGGGGDSLQILGSEQAERLVLYPGAEALSSLSTNTMQIELRGFEHVAFSGGGGRDRASLFDSSSSDTLTSHPGGATLTGPGFQFDLFDVPRIYVHGTAGGSDTAFLHDSAGDDALAVRPQFTSLKSEDAFQLAYGFERVYAYADAGGFDTAELYDSTGDDTMSVSSGRSIITGSGYQFSARIRVDGRLRDGGRA